VPRLVLILAAAAALRLPASAGPATAASAPRGVRAPRGQSAAPPAPTCAESPKQARLTPAVSLPWPGEAAASKRFTFARCERSQTLREGDGGWGVQATRYWVYQSGPLWLWLAATEWTRHSKSPAPPPETWLFVSDGFGAGRRWEASFRLAAGPDALAAQALEGELTLFDVGGGRVTRPVSAKLSF